MKALGQRSLELSILLCDDVFIRKLNREYRGVDTATDVLSFPMLLGDEPNPNPHLLGDVVISSETAIRQAKKKGKEPIDEVSKLLIHGVLHLIGYTHDGPADKKNMDRETKRIEASLKKCIRTK